MKKLMIGVLFLTASFSAYAMEKTIENAKNIYLSSCVLKKGKQQSLQGEIDRVKRLEAWDNLVIKAAKKWYKTKADWNSWKKVNACGYRKKDYLKQVRSFLADDTNNSMFIFAPENSPLKKEEVKAKRDLLEAMKQLQTLTVNLSNDQVIKAAQEWYQAQENDQQIHKNMGLGEIKEGVPLCISPSLLLQHNQAKKAEQKAKKILFTEINKLLQSYNK